jgi:uncharacterized repeat protein (TIGR02543 family)
LRKTDTSVNVYVLNSFVNTSEGEQSGAGEYLSGDTVTINAGSRSGYTFNGWTTLSDVTLADVGNPTTTFMIGEDDVSVSANWLAIPVYVTVIDSHVLTENGEESGEGQYTSGDTVTINGGARTGYTFAGWTTSDNVIFTDADRQITTFIIGDENVTVRANWNEDEIETIVNVTVIDSYIDTYAGEQSGEGVYSSGDTVTINAGSRDGFTFDQWTTFDGAVFADARSQITSFIAGDEDVTVIANWIPNTVIKFAHVEVLGSYVNTENGEQSGEGDYLRDDIVTINAGERSGYSFIGWLSADAVVFTEALSRTTTFTMGAENVTVIASWHKNADDGDGDKGDGGDGDTGDGGGGGGNVTPPPIDGGDPGANIVKPPTPDEREPNDERGPNQPPADIADKNQAKPPVSVDSENALVPEGDEYIELDANGVPKGKWKWNDATGWVFEAFETAGNLPKTGDDGFAPHLYMTELSLLAAVTILLFGNIKKPRYKHLRK